MTIAHDGAVEAINDFVDSRLGAVLKYFFLGSVMQNVVEFECPRLLLVVDYALGAVLGHAHFNRLQLELPMLEERRVYIPWC